jgi:hypothetical protein
MAGAFCCSAWALARSRRAASSDVYSCVDARQAGDFAERVAPETLHLVLGNREDAGVDGVADGNGDGQSAHRNIFVKNNAGTEAQRVQMARGACST